MNKEQFAELIRLLNRLIKLVEVTNWLLKDEDYAEDEGGSDVEPMDLDDFIMPFLGDFDDGDELRDKKWVV